MLPHNRRTTWAGHIVGYARTEFAALLPAVCLAWLWFGPEGAIIVAVAGLPLAVLSRRQPVPTQAVLGQRNLNMLADLSPRDATILSLDAAYEIEELSGKTTACLVIEVDEIARLQETFGRAAQETALCKTMERLQSVLRDNDTLKRIDGDRFAVAIAPIRRMDLETAIQIAGRLRAAVAEPLSIDAMTVYVGISVGFCLSARAPERSGKGLLAAAELALDEAVSNGPGAVRGYSADIELAAQSRDAMRERIEAALENGEIVAYFQPQLSTDTGDVVGFEALARWQHPQRGVLPPAEFLPTILSAGLCERLGEVMLAQALSALRGWDAAALNIPTVSVNFSKAELRNPNLIAKLKWEFDRFDLRPERLTVEILESVVAENEHDVIVHNIAALSKLGCSIDLDDFGTGHASIASIRRFAVDRIKIDRSYVTRIDLDQTQQQLVMAILSMAERMELKTLAEGIETIGEHALLAQLGCSHVQGYVIARPMPMQATAEWLRTHRGKLAMSPGVTRRTG
ncbi:MAG: GGDEF domain-containing phosphodiesterase [Albidovulum sp.]